MKSRNKDLQYQIERGTFHAKDVHTCFPWIAGNTFHNRVRTGLIPVEKEPEGTGRALELSFAGLVHCGVVDEMSATGAWTDRTEQVFELYPLPHDEKPMMSRELEPETLDFYVLYNFMVDVDVKIQHIPESGTKKMQRRKRASRLWWARFRPSAYEPPFDYSKLASAPVEQGRVPMVTFTTCKISVFKIYTHVCDCLGLVG